MQERCGASRKNDLPAYLSQHRSSLIEQRGARPQRHGRLHGYYTEKVLLSWRSNAPKFPAWGRLARVFLSMAPF
jgi:hypothetical protein